MCRKTIHKYWSSIPNIVVSSSRHCKSIYISTISSSVITIIDDVMNGQNIKWPWWEWRKFGVYQVCGDFHNTMIFKHVLCLLDIADIEIILLHPILPSCCWFFRERRDGLIDKYRLPLLALHWNNTYFRSSGDCTRTNTHFLLFMCHFELKEATGAWIEVNTI